MSDEITPALGEGDLIQDPILMVRGQGKDQIGAYLFNGVLHCGEALYQGRERHKVAALALHELTDEGGHQLGFTWDDVELLRTHVRVIEQEGPTGEQWGRLVQLRSIADRMAALLVPRSAY